MWADNACVCVCVDRTRARPRLTTLRRPPRRPASDFMRCPARSVRTPGEESGENAEEEPAETSETRTHTHTHAQPLRTVETCERRPPRDFCVFRATYDKYLYITHMHCIHYARINASSHQKHTRTHALRNSHVDTLLICYAICCICFTVLCSRVA